MQKGPRKSKVHKQGVLLASWLIDFLSLSPVLSMMKIKKQKNFWGCLNAN